MTAFAIVPAPRKSLGKLQFPRDSTLLNYQIFCSAPWWGQLFAKEMDFQKVSYTESLQCVPIVKETTSRFHKYATLIQDITESPRSW